MNVTNADCMKVEIPKCKLLLTDIPYNGVNRESNGLRKLDKGKADTETFNIREFLDHIYDSFEIAVIFCGANQFSEIFDYFVEKQWGGVRNGTTNCLVQI